jgi:hypothetical protein
MPGCFLPFSNTPRELGISRLDAVIAKEHRDLHPTSAVIHRSASEYLRQGEGLTDAGGAETWGYAQEAE